MNWVKYYSLVFINWTSITGYQSHYEMTYHIRTDITNLSFYLLVLKGLAKLNMI